MAPRVYSYIRFSTPEQAMGDSLRRQQALAEEYATRHGLVLDRSLKADEGLSAFSGENLKRGHLGVFIDKVKSGEVPRGSILLVESLDRLSRATVTVSLLLLIEVINLGVRVVTLCDNQTYDEASIAATPMTLMMSLLMFVRANEESETKSRRNKAAWVNKRNVIDSKKLGAWCPAWLRLSSDKTEYEEIPERVEAVKRIFTLIQEGRSNAHVARLFNAERIEPWGVGGRKGMMWHHSYVQKIVTGRAVLGEGQPCAMTDGKRLPIGPAVPGYYPQIISQEQFDRVQSLRVGRRKQGGRKVWDPAQRAYHLPNLFTHLAICGRCGHPMHYLNKGPGRRGGIYLVCSGAINHAGCIYRSVRYPRFEHEVLTYLWELDWAKLNADTARQETELSALQTKIDDTRFIVDGHRQKISLLIEGIGASGLNPASVVSKIQALEEEIAGEEIRRKSLEADHQIKSNSRQNSSSHVAVLRKNIQAQLKGEVLDPRIRAGVREQLLALVQKIEVIADPDWKEIQQRYGKDRDLKVMKLLFPEDEGRRCFVSIRFAAGAARWLLLSDAGGVAQEVL